MKVKIESMIPDPITLCAKSSYISHSNQKITQIFDGNKPTDPLEYIKKIVKMGHTSVLEHAYFNILIEDAPVTAEVFAINFRLASFTVKSRRYTDVVKDGFYETEKSLNSDFLKRVTLLYEKMIRSKIPREDARFILPYSFKTNFIMSMNARELGYFLHEAIHLCPLQEIKLVAEKIIDQLKNTFSLYKTDLEIFSKEKKSIQKLNMDSAPIKNPGSLTLLDSIDKPDETYQRIITFMITGGLPQKDFIDESLIEESLNTAHNRALEAIHFTFYINAITLAGLTHLLRHRMHSPIMPNIFSPELEYGYLIPPSIQDTPFKEEFLSLFNDSRQLEKETGNIYYRLVSATFPVITTINLRELLHFFRLRLCTRAQWEIRDIADKMLSLAKDKTLLLLKNAGPSCVSLGYCPEGSHGCGRFEEMIEKYSG